MALSGNGKFPITSRVLFNKINKSNFFALYDTNQKIIYENWYFDTIQVPTDYVNNLSEDISVSESINLFKNTDIALSESFNFTENYSSSSSYNPSMSEDFFLGEESQTIYSGSISSNEEVGLSDMGTGFASIYITPIAESISLIEEEVIKFDSKVLPLEQMNFSEGLSPRVNNQINFNENLLSTESLVIFQNNQINFNENLLNTENLATFQNNQINFNENLSSVEILSTLQNNQINLEEIIFQTDGIQEANNIQTNVEDSNNFQGICFQGIYFQGNSLQNI